MEKLVDVSEMFRPKRLAQPSETRQLLHHHLRVSFVALMSAVVHHNDDDEDEDDDEDAKEKARKRRFGRLKTYRWRGGSRDPSQSRFQGGPTSKGDVGRGHSQSLS